jgi:hypothetical protein
MVAYALCLVGAFLLWNTGHRLPSLLLAIGVACAGIAANDVIALTVPWMKGENAEAAVRKELEQLRWDGYVVVNDLMFGGEGNIDHLVSGPNGVFIVETKFGSYEMNHLAKVKRQACRLHDELDVFVTPVVCSRVRPKTFTHARVLIAGRGHLADAIRTAPPHRAVDPARLRRFVDSL